MAYLITRNLWRPFINVQNKILGHYFCTNPKGRTWKVLKVNHLAVASANIEKSVKLFQDIFGAKTSQSIPMPEHGVTTAFVELGNVKLELLLPLGEKSPIQSFLQKNGNGGMHHICLDVDNIDNAVKDMKAHNIRTLTEETKIGAHGKPVIFLHPKDCGGVLIELQQV
ncbi:methylmalonyl-CoA epimerase, mitochondrial [Parasteatoda tepidariorum]|uniref:methylmalonyl-CoA epimerase, mitochondrial n=1 Tax=Parasteatoda tepidariorum TaxID=114398 RepID=UPI00077FD96D|nr:methylmalonyl-CoA epimerase, mitochondrial [Parasteatoda tepidariorum]